MSWAVLREISYIISELPLLSQLMDAYPWSFSPLAYDRFDSDIVYIKFSTFPGPRSFLGGVSKHIRVYQVNSFWDDFWFPSSLTLSPVSLE